MEKYIKQYIEIIEASWTFSKMSKEEKERFYNILNSERLKNTLKGTEKQKWNILQLIYYAFLEGLGYNGFKWRDENETPLF